MRKFFILHIFLLIYSVNYRREFSAKYRYVDWNSVVYRFRRFRIIQDSAKYNNSYELLQQKMGQLKHHNEALHKGAASRFHERENFHDSQNIDHIIILKLHASRIHHVSRFFSYFTIYEWPMGDLLYYELSDGAYKKRVRNRRPSWILHARCRLQSSNINISRKQIQTWYFLNNIHLMFYKA